MILQSELLSAVGGNYLARMVTGDFLFELRF